MKTKIFKAGVAMSLCIAALATSCSDKIEEDYTPLKEQVPLEVSVAGINETRSIITGTTLPDSCDFSVYYNSDWSVNAINDNGTWKLIEPIFIDEDTNEAPVYAFFPISSSKTVFIDTSEQKDYLRGISVDNNGNPTRIGFENPKAKILFEHILARITLNIHKDTELKESYKIPDIYLRGIYAQSHIKGKFDIVFNSFQVFDINEGQYIKGELKDGKYWLETPEDKITVDFLMIPQRTSWGLNLKDFSADWYTLPENNYESGKQYIYDCLIKEDDKPYLTITECDIRPWDSTTMPEVEGY